jgi:hypothetical protein
MPIHYYPHDVAVALHQRWPSEAAPPPDPTVLTELISALYQASLLFEEGRAVECHVVWATLAQLEAQPVKVLDFHIMRFAEPRAWNEQELRRLSPAVQYPSSLLAVEQAPSGRLQVWGMVFSEHKWDQVLDGAGQEAQTPPQALLIQVSGPGNLVFYYGARRLLTLQRGRIDGHGFLLFPMAWGKGRFVENHLLAGQLLGDAPLAPAHDELMLQLVLYMQRRALTRMRTNGHGGLVVLVPTDRVAALTITGSVLRPKYRLLPTGAGPRYSAVIQALVQRLLEVGEASWDFLQTSHDENLRSLMAQIDHFADCIAAMTAVDGALVLTQQIDIVGFGVEIQATQVPLNAVYQALDVEGTNLQAVPADHGGTRHRAAYRLCLAAPDCLAIIVSQDGNVQFVHNQDGKVVFWDQLAF